jgi:hypothetical protein
MATLEKNYEYFIDLRKQQNIEKGIISTHNTMFTKPPNI